MGKFRIPRKKKKAIKNALITYDVSAIPSGLEFDKLWEIWLKNGLLIYDSSLGSRPRFTNRIGKRAKIAPLKKVEV